MLPAAKKNYPQIYTDYAESDSGRTIGSFQKLVVYLTKNAWREEAPAEGASDEDVSSDLWGEFHIVLMLEDETESRACKRSFDGI